VVRSIHKGGLCFAADFACNARRYWLTVFPRVTLEIHRARVLATRIPDPTLRRLALESLEDKRGNLEGAAAFAALASKQSRPFVVKALVACQAICDYLDLLAEQTNPDPVANGYKLHEALLVATARGEPHRDYYTHHPHGEDGGYLVALVDTARTALSALPSISSVRESIGRAAERIAVYQSFNHGDARGSYELFERWARRANPSCAGLRPWEAAVGAGSTLAVLALIASAADPLLESSTAEQIDQAYFPWIGSLHSLLDSLVDHERDIAVDGRALLGYYASPDEAAVRMGQIADESLSRAAALPEGRRHSLILAAMTSFYICELQGSASPHARLVAPSVLDAIGGMAGPSMAVLGARRSLRRISIGAPNLAGSS
jgi:tetraprenyl-beta-curcumene synthase